MLNYFGSTGPSATTNRRVRNTNTFKFKPDLQDPNLELGRSNVNADYGYNKADTVNELSRAGLIGSSASIGSLNRVNTDRAKALENSDQGVLSNQRSEQLGLFKDQQDFNRELERMKILQGYQNSGVDRASILGGATKLGGLAALLAMGPAAPLAGAAGMTGALSTAGWGQSALRAILMGSN